MQDQAVVTRIGATANPAAPPLRPSVEAVNLSESKDLRFVPARPQGNA